MRELLQDCLGEGDEIYH